MQNYSKSNNIIIPAGQGSILPYSSSGYYPCYAGIPGPLKERFLKIWFFRLWLLVFLGLRQFLRWNRDHFQLEILWFLWAEWTILRLFYPGVYCAKMCTFWDVALFYHLMGLGQFLRWNSDNFQSEFLWFLLVKWTIIRLIYYGVYCANMCYYWDISVCIGLSQFLEVKSTSHPNSFFMFFML